MKLRYLAALLGLLGLAGAAPAQTLKFALDSVGLFSVPPDGTDGSGEYYVYFRIVNISPATVNALANRTENNLASGHGSFFCWDLCYDSTRDASESPISINASDTTRFGQYLVLRPNNLTGSSTVKMVFTDIATGQSIERSFRFAVGTLSVEPDASLASWGAAYPVPAREEVFFSYSLRSSAPAEAHLVDAQGRLLLRQPLGAGEGLAHLPLAGLASGMYWLQLRIGGELAGQQSLSVQR